VKLCLLWCFEHSFIAKTSKNTWKTYFYHKMLWWIGTIICNCQSWYHMLYESYKSENLMIRYVIFMLITCENNILKMCTRGVLIWQIKGMLYIIGRLMFFVTRINLSKVTHRLELSANHYPGWGWSGVNFHVKIWCTAWAVMQNV
jgi:hypothetical protein